MFIKLLVTIVILPLCSFFSYPHPVLSKKLEKKCERKSRKKEQKMEEKLQGVVLKIVSLKAGKAREIGWLIEVSTGYII